MVAVFDVSWDYGGTDNSPGTTSESVTNLRFNAEDTNDQDLASPIIIPGAGTEYSYWKQLYLECTTAPDTQVDNVKIYSDGTLGWGTGSTVKIGDELPVHNSGATTGYDVANAQEVMTNHTDITGSTDLFSFTSGSPKTVSISEAGSIINAIGETSNYIVLQLEVASTASAGTKAAETITWQYDEV